jgi:hypothetical protein
VTQRASRKRRQRNGPTATPAAPVDVPAPPADAFERRYARSRAKDDAARATLKPLEPGERPTAVTVGAIVTGVFAVANTVALAFGYNTNEVRAAIGTVLMSLVLALVAWGMWHAKYWAVLGLQTLLGLTVVLGALGLTGANNLRAVALLLVIVAGAGTLFWFLIKAMARIQMPPRPGASA